MHRDLKPENLILRSSHDNYDICIADFGLAEFHNKNQEKYLFTRCGTPGYVAPEILGDQNYDFKVDVFSLGVILFIM
jgi:calcium/calmodulin-dependent protein kinase I